MFKTVRNNWQKSKAAVLVEQAFSKSPVPFIIPEGPAKFATSLVDSLWTYDPRSLDGSTGPKPSPIAVAAAALAQGLSDHRESTVRSGTCFGALRSLLREVGVNRYHYALNGLDLVLLNIAEHRLTANANELRPTPVSKALTSKAEACPPVQSTKPEILNKQGGDIDKRLKSAKSRRR